MSAVCFEHVGDDGTIQQSLARRGFLAVRRGGDERNSEATFQRRAVRVSYGYKSGVVRTVNGGGALVAGVPFCSVTSTVGTIEKYQDLEAKLASRLKRRWKTSGGKYLFIEKGKTLATLTSYLPYFETHFAVSYLQ